MAATLGGCVRPSPHEQGEPTSTIGELDTSQLTCAPLPPATPEPPSNAIVIAPSDDVASVVEGHVGGSTFWFERGVHTTSRAIQAKQGDHFVGAPDAVLDGQFTQPTAFTGNAANVVVDHLTVTRFGTPDGLGSINTAVVNRAAAPGWTVSNSIFTLNDGAALFAGENSVTTHNCFARNAQYGVSVPSHRTDDQPRPIRRVQISENEFFGQPRADLAGAGRCAGCSGAMKLWNSEQASVTKNSVHHNNGVGVWLDNNNVDAHVTDNDIYDNEAEGIVLETSYNSEVSRNHLRHNAWGAGRRRSQSDRFPDAAIFVSNSGGSQMLPGSPMIDVSDNDVIDNFNGVTVFQDANRFCGSSTDTSVGSCTLTGGSLGWCADALQGAEDAQAVLDTCHWNTTAIRVHHNTFVADLPEFQQCISRCARNAIVATDANTTATIRLPNGNTESTSNPVTPSDVRQRLTSPGAVDFSGNSYRGNWSFSLGTAEDVSDVEQWRQSGYDQDSSH